jgi:hypothetical protein
VDIWTDVEYYSEKEQATNMCHSLYKSEMYYAEYKKLIQKPIHEAECGDPHLAH